MGKYDKHPLKGYWHTCKCGTESHLPYGCRMRKCTNCGTVLRREVTK